MNSINCFAADVFNEIPLNRDSGHLGARSLIHYQPSVDSTQEWAKRSVGNSGLNIFLTDHQEKGRGRFDRNWIDQGTGSQFLSTWKWVTSRRPGPECTMLFGLALYRSCKKIWPLQNWSIKAPNDIYLDSHKVGGLLTEVISTSSDQFEIILGVGLNILSHPRINHSGAFFDSESSSYFQKTSSQKIEAESIQFQLKQFFRGLYCDFLFTSMDLCEREASAIFEFERSSLFAAMQNHYTSPRLANLTENGILEFQDGNKKSIYDL